jgi:hypothetical protein
MYKIIGSDGREYGPVPAETLRQWIAVGRVNGATRALAEGANEWVALQQLPEFAAALTAPPPLQSQTRPVADSGLGQVIPYRNGQALAAYYCGIFALIPCFGLVLGIIAFVLGMLGLKKHRAQPECGGKVHAWVGIILGGLCALGNIGAIIAMVISAARH